MNDKTIVEIAKEKKHKTNVDEVIIIDPEANKRNNLNKANTSFLIINAVVDTIGEEAPIFLDICDSFSNFSEMIIYCFEKLNYRERRMVSARLGFDMIYFTPKPKQFYIDISLDHGLSSAETSSSIVKRSLRKIAEQMIFSGEEVYNAVKLSRTTC